MMLSRIIARLPWVRRKRIAFLNELVRFPADWPAYQAAVEALSWEDTRVLVGTAGRCGLVRARNLCEKWHIDAKEIG